MFLGHIRTSQWLIPLGKGVGQYATDHRLNVIDRHYLISFCSGILAFNITTNSFNFVKPSLRAKPCVPPTSSFSCRSNSFLQERFCKRTRFETEAQGNSEMAYLGHSA